MTELPVLPEPTLSTSFVDASPLLDQPEQLRARAADDGVLFFRDRLPKEAVEQVHQQISQILLSRGLVERDQESGQLIARPEGAEESYYGTSVGKQTYTRIQKLQAFHELSHHPALLEIYSALFGEPVLVHPRNIARLQIPTERSVPTPSHQDFIHIQGTTSMWTAWVPLSDCPVELGGLTVLAGSHREGILDYRAVAGAGSMEAYTCGLDYVWVQGDYRAGDVITFNSQTVHKAMPNQTNRARISVDLRYQSASEPVTPESLLPHGDDLPWEEVYRGWDSTQLQYYWKELPLTLAPFDEKQRWQKEHIC